jgi:hypothetical protein
MNITRDTIIKEIEQMLGGSMIDVELDPDDYHLAITKSLERYRQRSDNAVQESFMPLLLETEKTDYTLPDEVIEVKQIYRRSVGVGTSSSNNFEPFEAQFLNNYLLHSGRAGGLAVYDALAQHRELLGRMFGADLNFTFNRVTKNLFIHRKMRAEDEVIVHIFNYKPEEQLFNDVYAGPWLKDYSLSMSKLMLAEARGKYNTIAGPQGGTTLNADSLRTTATEELTRLENELKMFVAGGGGYGFIIG